MFENIDVFKIHYDQVEQWFSTFGCWRPTKQNNTQFCDPNVAIIVLKHRFW